MLKYVDLLQQRGRVPQAFRWNFRLRKLFTCGRPLDWTSGWCVMQPVLGRFWWENLRGAPCDVVIPDLGCLYTYSSKSRDFLWTTCTTKLRDEDLEKSWTDPSLMQLWIRNYVVILFSPLWSVLIWYNERNTGGTETAVTSACLYFENQ